MVYPSKRNYKKTYTKKKRAAPMRTIRGKMPITMSNPFNAIVLAPKIPDGLTYSSCGLRLQQAINITQGLADDMILIFYPGIEGGLYIYDQFSSFNNDDGSDYTYNNHLNLGAQNPPTQIPSVRVTQWRLVSQALRLTSVNNCEEADGWFEAIRVDTAKARDAASAMWEIRDGSNVPVAKSRLNNAGATTTTPRGANVQLWSGYQSITNFIEQPSYVTGKLKDLQKHVFQLRPQVREFEFTKLTQGPGAYADEFVDDNFDTIVIKIHGRAPVNADDGGGATRIMAHWISNQEICYDENTQLSRYMTECKYNSSAMAALKSANVQKGVKASYTTKKKS